MLVKGEKKCHSRKRIEFESRETCVRKALLLAAEGLLACFLMQTRKLVFLHGDGGHTK